jgi:rsbT co-antagonist protein RsbR
MRCEHCVLTDRTAAAAPLEQFLDTLSDCEGCPELASGPVALTTAYQRLCDSARALRKSQGKLRQRERDLEVARASAEQHEARIQNLEHLYKQGTRELEPQLAVVQRQTATILALSAPLLDVSDGVLAMPIIGSLDDQRTQLLTDSLLDGIRSRRARWAILDLTALEAVDGQTAARLLRVCTAVKLLGAKLILCGIRSAVAIQLVQLDATLNTVHTAPTLRAALRLCSTALPIS